ncbi:MAG: choice-of-anchor D domain-containing protein [Candidatus Eisenbacteria bacterium]
MAPEPFRGLAARLALALAACFVLSTPAHALRLINHNILNYPGTTGAARDPNYRVIYSPLAPDIVVTQEMTSQAGCTQFLASMNVMNPGEWAGVPFVDGPDTDSGVFYKTAKLQFINQWSFYPNSANLLRLVHAYRFRPVGYTTNAADFIVYAVHLKASTGFEAQRALECTGLRDTMNALPPGTHALVMGDYNFYTGLEPGMQKLLELQADNDGRLYDPLGLQNIAWQDNTTMQYAWTQSPCKTGDTGCASGAATGGIDDRFDLILPTLSWQDGLGYELVPGSYTVVGNDGLHHNNSIQDLPVIPEGAAYATALHSTSDHMPVRVDLRLPARLDVSSAPLAFGTVIVGATAGTTLAVTNGAWAPGETMSYTYAAPAGFTAPGGTSNAAAGATNNDAIALDTSAPGAFAGNLVLTSNAVENATRNIALSGTVLRHASPSLDSTAALVAGELDLGTHAAGGFVPGLVRVHNRGFDALQARLSLEGAAITGGAGRFALTSAFTPSLVSGTGAAFGVAFDDAGATTDSLYEATLTFTTADEVLPGRAALAPLAVTLHAQVNGGGTTGVEAGPTATLLYAPYPNPLRAESTVRFDVARAGDVALEVFDVSGRRAATLLRTSLSPGRYSVRWDGRGEDGQAHAGLYFIRLTTAGAPVQNARLAILR